jgi:hypothetical protein
VPMMSATAVVPSQLVVMRGTPAFPVHSPWCFLLGAQRSERCFGSA